MIRERKTLILDAMGVIYKAGDDVAELLVPFVRARNKNCDIAAIDAVYRRASLGELSAAVFWQSIGMHPSVEDEYLLTHELTEGLLQFLPIACERFDRILCLSNDVSEWSAKLRKRFDLERFISGWFISGDMGTRKPSFEIYEQMLTTAGLRPDEVVFVDDRPKNLNAAKPLGITTLLFDTDNNSSPKGLAVARSFSDVLDCACGFD